MRGPATLAAMGIFKKTSGGQGNINLLARLISAEARGEPYTGQVAVGAVVLNRIEHPSFPDTMAGVIYQKGAFTCLTDGQFNQQVSESAYRAARGRAERLGPVRRRDLLLQPEDRDQRMDTQTQGDYHHRHTRILRVIPIKNGPQLCCGSFFAIYVKKVLTFTLRKGLLYPCRWW